MIKELKKRRIIFLAMLAVFAVIAFLYFFESGMNEQNTTALALNYRYGLIPRGFVGTLVYLVQKAGISLYSYQGAMYISGALTVVLFLVIFLFFGCCLKKCDSNTVIIAETGIGVLSVFLFSEYATVNNFGRLDEYLMLVTVLCLLLLVWGKWEWLIVPLCGIAGLIHIGFVFTNVAVILVLLSWKILSSEEKRKRYIAIFATTFLLVSVLFLYFELFREPVGEAAYQEIIRTANLLAPKGQIENDAYSLLKSELLGQSVFADEWVWHTKNYVEFPIFVVLFMPYILLAVIFFKNLIKSAEDTAERWKYIFVAVGIGTILPELILKVDYGRWVYCIVTYYCFVLLSLVALGDKKIICQLVSTGHWLQKKFPCCWILLIYPFLFVPFRDVYISDVTTWLMDHIVAPLLGLW